MVDANGTVIERLALIGNFLPRQCGLATFTTDVHSALRNRFPEIAVDVYAMDDHPGRYEYPEAVVGTVPQHDRAAYVEAGRKIIQDSGIPIITADTLADAAEKAVAAYKNAK